MLRRYWNHLWTEMSETGRKTFPWDMSRGAAAGATATLNASFALIVAIQFFDASLVQKSIIAGAHFAGLMASLFYAAWSPVIHSKTVRAALPAFVASGGLVVAALAGDSMQYTAGMVAFGLCTGLPVPIMTSIYRDNYRSLVRGQVFGITLYATVLVTLLVQFAGGWMLDQDLDYFRPLFVGLAVFGVVRGISILRMPNTEGGEPLTINPLTSFSTVRENPLFGYVLLAWFLFGFANLALLPQRIEYLSQEQYGLELSPGAIVLIVGVVPDFMRLCVIQLWARLFDRYNFIWLRIVLSSFLLVNVLLFFNTHSVPLLVLASASLGVGFGGGAVAWTLWVTKFAPPEETARYMSVHTFLTGLRGSLGPLVGYLTIEYLDIRTVSWVSGTIIFASILMLWRIRNRLRANPDEAARAA